MSHSDTGTGTHWRIRYRYCMLLPTSSVQICAETICAETPGDFTNVWRRKSVMAWRRLDEALQYR
jgi:hypothetical protein